MVINDYQRKLLLELLAYNDSPIFLSYVPTQIKDWAETYYLNDLGLRTYFYVLMICGKPEFTDKIRVTKHYVRIDGDGIFSQECYDRNLVKGKLTDEIMYRTDITIVSRSHELIADMSESKRRDYDRYRFSNRSQPPHPPPSS